MIVEHFFCLLINRPKISWFSFLFRAVDELFRSNCNDQFCYANACSVKTSLCWQIGLLEIPTVSVWIHLLMNNRSYWSVISSCEKRPQQVIVCQKLISQLCRARCVGIVCCVVQRKADCWTHSNKCLCLMKSINLGLLRSFFCVWVQVFYLDQTSWIVQVKPLLL